MRNGKISQLSDFDSQGLNELWLWLQAMLPKTAPFKKGGGGGGGGGTVTNELEVCWGGMLPTVLGNGTVWPVPFEDDGTSKTYSMSYLKARIESLSTGSVSFRLEQSLGGQVAFVPVVTQAISIVAGTYEKVLQAPGDFTAFSVDSGDLLRVVYTAVGPDCAFSVTMVGAE